jgi:hypothetical protein
MHLRTLLSNELNDLSSALDSTQVSQVSLHQQFSFPWDQFWLKFIC